MALYHSARGSVGYTIVGSPTIVDGVASDFSSSNYLKTDTTFSQDVYNAWIQNSETVVKFRTNVLQAQHIIYIPTGGSYAGFYMRGSQGKINWQIYSTSYRISPDFVFSVNTDYWLKGTIRNGVATFSYSTDGTNYTTLGTLDLQGITDPGSYTSYVQFGYGSAELGPVNGSIDLNHTYITVNGQPWFGICPVEVKKHQIMGPNGYTVEGSPSIIDGVMSNISNDNYAYTLTNSTMYQSIVDFETCIKFTTGTTAPTGSLFGWQNGHGGAYLNNSSRIRCVAIDFKEKKYRDYLTSFSALQANKTYYFKYEFKNNQGSCSLKEEGGEWQTEQIETGANNFNNPSNYKYFYGRNNQASGYLTGGASIDFNNTYIKVNGKLWFWQPRETERIVVNGVEVWTKPQES